MVLFRLICREINKLNSWNTIVLNLKISLSAVKCSSQTPRIILLSILRRNIILKKYSCKLRARLNKIDTIQILNRLRN